MPEGHTIHRLAAALTELYQGQRLHASSPQGRFAAGAERLDGQVLLGAQAHGKHLFVAFAPEGDVAWDLPRAAQEGERSADAPPLTWLRVHLGLYGSWTFDGDATFTAPHAIGAPRRRVGERGEHALAPGSGSALSGTPDGKSADGASSGGAPASRTFADPALAEAVPADRELAGGASSDGVPAGGTSSDGAPAAAPGQWQVPEPRGAVRLRLLGEHGVADLTGPAACELLDGSGVAAVRRRLGPDPLRDDGDPRVFIEAVRRRRRAVGELLMDQSVISGVGNIYRAETLLRCGVSPFTPGNRVSEKRLRALWDDLVPLMGSGVATGLITTVAPDDVPDPVPAGDEEARRWYVYHRTGRPCLRCGRPVSEKEVAGRRLFWCAGCQSR